MCAAVARGKVKDGVDHRILHLRPQPLLQFGNAFVRRNSDLQPFTKLLKLVEPNGVLAQYKLFTRSQSGFPSQTRARTLSQTN
jgi:hypothetical protein